ncbi:hypothetical protein [Spirulina major]|uniref:hypothetical protein n=1 Tax=Spirulina major TaxID=270636 RepID=UPI000933903C|nr:hypothetical protein [Spirulina major]
MGYDLRRTRFKESFHQLGFGGDLQSSRWVGRFNGYLPVGDRRRQVAQNQVATTANQTTNVRFTEERLLYDLLRQKTLTTTRQFQTAVAGWDLEAGYSLWAWETGRIYSYWGVYGLNIPRKGRYLGMRGRLLGEFNDRWTAGITVSTDGHFGTQLTVKLGAVLGGQSAKTDPSPTVLARLGRGVERQEAIDRPGSSARSDDNGDARSPHGSNRPQSGNGGVLALSPCDGGSRGGRWDI